MLIFFTDAPEKLDSAIAMWKRSEVRELLNAVATVHIASYAYAA